MAFSLKIKEEYKSTVIGFNHSGLPLGSRNDLVLLAEMAKNDAFIANMFEELPTDEQLQQLKKEEFLAAHPEPQEETTTNRVPALNPEEHGSDTE